MTSSGLLLRDVDLLNAVKAAGTTDADKVMNELHKTKIDDMFTDNGVIRADGLMQHDIRHAGQEALKVEIRWDYYRIVKKISGERAFGGLANSTRLARCLRSEAEIVSTMRIAQARCRFHPFATLGE